MKKILFTFIAVMSIIIGTNSFAAKTNENDEPMSFFSDSGNCITGVFEAREDNWTGKLALWSNCTFTFVEREGRDIYSNEGTYSIDGDVAPGQIAYITFYVNGQNYGQATIAWPLEGGLQVLMNGYTFTKI